MRSDDRGSARRTRAHAKAWLYFALFGSDEETGEPEDRSETARDDASDGRSVEG
ncbi:MULTISPECIES: hypothetical protein [Halorubrum]|uniref:hypothetical protein n=1 Tax=Halorubrum TaxID=56688 RepID=UPI00130534DF|nr:MULTISPECIES: hypothetical protein [Halorubrum]